MTIMTRRQLYDLIWSKPMRDATAEIGISDVGLKKALVEAKARETAPDKKIEAADPARRDPPQPVLGTRGEREQYCAHEAAALAFRIRHLPHRCDGGSARVRQQDRRTVAAGGAGDGDRRGSSG
jgi:hypothetical protein